MQYITEDVSPVKKKITVTVPAEEGEAALSATLAMYRSSLTLDGFRKGKVPTSMVEQRFRKEIYNEATTELVNVHINQIITEGKFNPVSRIDFDGGQLERGKDFVYALSFEVLPDFELPPYEGLEVEQEDAVVNEDEITAVVDRLRQNMAEVTTVGESRTAKDGDIAVIDFEAFDENDKPIEGIKAENFQLSLGEGQTLPDFETLLKTLKPGDSGEGPVAFPADFFNPEFAGRTVTMKTTLHALKQRKMEDADDAFAKKAGGFESMEKLRESVRESYKKSRTELHKGAAQKNLIDGLLKMMDFVVPESMMESNMDMLMGRLTDSLERQGKSLASLGKSEQVLRDEMRPEAETNARTQIFLLAVARKEELVVTDGEIDTQIRRIAMQSSQDYNTVRDYYVRNNLIFPLRDKMLADKAMEAVYDKATVKIVPAKEAEASGDAEEKPQAEDE